MICTPPLHRYLRGEEIGSCQRSLTDLGVRGYFRQVTDVDSLSAAADAAASSDPEVGLRAAQALQRLQERLEAIHVANAREQGWSWQAIADALGVSRQAVHQKYNRRR